jgi:hypothetical protein
MSRSVVLTQVIPNLHGNPLTTGEGYDPQTGETVIFAGSNAMMGNLNTLLAQFEEHGKGDQPVINVLNELIIEIKEPT